MHRLPGNLPLLAALLTLGAFSCTPKKSTPTDPCNPNPCTEEGKTVCTAGADQTSHTCACDTRGFQDDGQGGCKELFDTVQPPTPAATMTGLARVLDANEVPVAGAQVTVGSRVLATDASGSVSFSQLSSQQPTPATVTADGYAPAGLLFDAVASFRPVVVHLAKLAPPVSLPAANGGTASLGSRSVSFTPDAFLKADGTPYTGMVSVQLASSAGAGERTPQLLSGSSGRATVRGLFAVTIRGEDGNDLQLAPDQPAVVHLPIPSDVLALPGDTLRLAYFDTKSSAWDVYSSCVVQPLPDAAQSLDAVMECVGTVPHFTPIGLLTQTNEQMEQKSWCLNYTFQITKPQRCQVLGATVGLAGGPETATSPLQWTADDSTPPESVRVSVALSCTGGAAPSFAQDVAVDPSELTEDCSGSVKTFNVDLGSNPAFDEDGDEFFTGDGVPEDRKDCDDQDGKVHPGVEEVPCNGQDDNCDGVTDTSTTWDAEGMTPAYWNAHCSASCFLRAAEVPGNAWDEDCNGTVSDADADHFLAAGDTFTADGYTAGDCDDTKGDVHPGADDLAGDLIDQDCTNGPHDVDGDGFLSPTELSRVSVEMQTKPDCSDFDEAYNPGSTVSEKSLALLGYFVEDATDQKVHRTAEYCALFDTSGALTPESRRLLFRDFNCNGRPDDLDGDGWLPYATPEHPTAWDCNDLDPRIFPADGDMANCQPADATLVNDSACAPKLDEFGGGARPLCPAIPGKDVPAQCVDLVDQNNDSWGVFVCQPTQYNFQDPLYPFAFGEALGPCDFSVTMPPCGAGLQCAGPMTWSLPYLAKLKSDFGYDVAAQAPWLGMCLPTCGDRCSVRPSPCGEPHKGQCKLKNRQPVCTCDPGYVDSAGTCIPAGTACVQDPPFCRNGGTCAETTTEVSCSCPSRYVGTHCEQLANPCEGYTCWNGSCAVVSSAPTCECKPGWTGGRCEADVNECLASGVCDEHATCTNTNGSYRCTCQEGYVGNGVTCQTAPPLLSGPITCRRTGVNNKMVMLTAEFSLALARATFPYLINGSSTTMFHGISKGTNSWTVGFYPDEHSRSPKLRFIDSEAHVLDTVDVPCTW